MASRQARHRWTVLALLLVLAGMTVLVSESVSIYNLVCRVTGLGGTTQVATEAKADAIMAEGEKFPVITVRFNADVNADIPWSFYPVQRQVKVQIGVPQTIYYRAVNHSSQRVTGTATFNVTPLQVGSYFDKIQCFCFTEQTLEPGQSVEMPVRFFVDPAILKDPDGSDFKTITLSYTFFRAKEQAGDTPQASNNGATNTSLN
jgi:cytochrome c oxidase assembly protein subunit 11